MFSCQLAKCGAELLMRVRVDRGTHTGRTCTAPTQEVPPIKRNLLTFCTETMLTTEKFFIWLHATGFSLQLWQHLFRCNELIRPRELVKITEIFFTPSAVHQKALKFHLQIKWAHIFTFFSHWLSANDAQQLYKGWRRNCVNETPTLEDKTQWFPVVKRKRR